MQIIVLIAIIAFLVFIYSKYLDKQYREKKEYMLKKYNCLITGLMKGNESSITLIDENNVEIKFIVNSQIYRMRIWLYHQNELLIDFYNSLDKKILRWEFDAEDNQNNMLRTMGLDLIKFDTSKSTDKHNESLQNKEKSCNTKGKSDIQKMSEKYPELTNGLCALKVDTKITSDEPDMEIISMPICDTIIDFYIISPDIEGNINIWASPKGKELGFSKDWKFSIDYYELDMVCKISDDIEACEREKQKNTIRTK